MGLHLLDSINQPTMEYPPHCEHHPPVVKAIDVVQGILTRSRPHLLRLSSRLVLESPIFFNGFAMVIGGPRLVIMCVFSVAGWLMGGEVKFGNEKDEAFGPNTQLGLRREGLHSLKEMDAPLADDVVGYHDDLVFRPLHRC